MFMITKLNYNNACEELKGYFLDYCKSIGADIEWVSVDKYNFNGRIEIELNYALKNDDCHNTMMAIAHGRRPRHVISYEMIHSQYNTNNNTRYGFFDAYSWAYCTEYEGKPLSEVQKKLNEATDAIARKTRNKSLE